MALAISFNQTKITTELAWTWMTFILCCCNEKPRHVVTTAKLT